MQRRPQERQVERSLSWRGVTALADFCFLLLIHGQCERWGVGSTTHFHSSQGTRPLAVNLTFSVVMVSAIPWPLAVTCSYLASVALGPSHPIAVTVLGQPCHCHPWPAEGVPNQCIPDGRGGRCVCSGGPSGRTCCGCQCAHAHQPSLPHARTLGHSDPGSLFSMAIAFHRLLRASLHHSIPWGHGVESLDPRRVPPNQ